jgi:hypothetical protein
MTDPGAAPPRGGRKASEQAADAAPAPSQAATGASASQDDIARRAYELYQQRGGGDGQEVDDWLRAEAELRSGRRNDET